MYWPTTVVEAPTETVTGTVPVPAGATASIAPSAATVKLSAEMPPKLTPVTPVKPDPVKTTVFPPAAVPESGLTELCGGHTIEL